MSGTDVIREALDGLPVSVAARTYGPGSPFPKLRNSTAIEISVGDGELGSHTIDLELDDAVEVAETILALVKSVRAVEDAAGAYLSYLVAVGAKCYCGADADAVIHSDLLGRADVCQGCGEREIERMRRTGRTTE